MPMPPIPGQQVPVAVAAAAGTDGFGGSNPFGGVGAGPAAPAAAAETVVAEQVRDACFDSPVAFVVVVVYIKHPAVSRYFIAQAA